MRARNGGGKKRRAGKTTVRCSGLLHWDEFASAPWGPSTAAEQSSAQRERERREERGERQAKQAFAATAGSNSMAGAKIRSRILDSGLLLRRARRPNRWRVMERMGERRVERNKSMRLFFLTLHRADSPTLSVPFQSSAKDFILPILALLL